MVLVAANDVRRAGCMQQPGLAADAALRPARGLDEAALQMQRGRTLDEALAASTYRATAAAAIRIHARARNRTSPPDLDAVRNALSARFCTQLTSAEFVDIGAVRDGSYVWLVLGSPFSPPGPDRAPAVAARVLELVNRDRARGRACGDTHFDPTTPLMYSELLERAATAHALGLRTLGRLSHHGSDGSRAADRISREGYAWSSVGENLALGPTSPEEVVEGWFQSPIHCANLMNPRYTDMGIAYVTSDAGVGEIYWVQEFAAPREPR